MDLQFIFAVKVYVIIIYVNVNHLRCLALHTVNVKVVKAYSLQTKNCIDFSEHLQNMHGS